MTSSLLSFTVSLQVLTFMWHIHISDLLLYRDYAARRKHKTAGQIIRSVFGVSLASPFALLLKRGFKTGASLFLLS